MRFVLFAFLVLQQSVTAFSFTDPEKKALVEDAKRQADKYAAAAVNNLRQNEVELPSAVSINDYVTLRDRILDPDWFCLLEYQLPATNKECRDGDGAVAVYYEGRVTILCDKAFENTSQLKSRLTRIILHEEVHAAQHHNNMSPYSDNECKAAEIAGVVMLLSKNYEMDDDYTISRRCKGVAQVFRAVQKDLKKRSTPLAPGQILTVSGSLEAKDLKEQPVTYIGFDTTNDEVVTRLKSAKQWRIVELNPADLYGGAEFRETTFQAVKMVLQQPGSLLQIELTMISTGLEIYTDDFEDAFTGKIRITGHS
ncbi:MAG: hypothetical protein WCW52_09680 [Elusimicrobiales bacterium]|jgi:hypothetical protein